MPIDEAYNSWAENYDVDKNKTRDLEKIAAQQTIGKHNYSTIIELGCGTGKNTEWLKDKATSLIGLDFSPQMLQKAREKIKSDKVQFRMSDLTKPWDVQDNYADLISCSLTLEHIKNLSFIYSEAFKKLNNNGLLYICELHPFKQYGGSKARYTNNNKTIELEVYPHHVSEYTNTAINNGFSILEINEWFDNNDCNSIPRLISFVFKKERESTKTNSM